jgi:hypothetical protein
MFSSKHAGILLASGDIDPKLEKKEVCFNRIELGRFLSWFCSSFARRIPHPVCLNSSFEDGSA